MAVPLEVHMSPVRIAFEVVGMAGFFAVVLAYFIAFT